MAFSPDGKTVLTGSQDKTARLWDAATGEPIGQPMEHRTRGHARGVQPRRQGRTHRQLGQDGAALGRRHRQAHRATLEHKTPVTAVAFSPDGKAVLTGS